METKSKTVKVYRRSDGVIPFIKWFKNLRDIRGKQKIQARIDRAQLGNLGDHRTVGEGVIELKIDFGPGYRIYLGQDGDSLIILLIGGDKNTQGEDIKEAKIYWKRYKEGKKYASD